MRKQIERNTKNTKNSNNMKVQLSLSNMLYKCACGHSVRCDNQDNVMNVETHDRLGVHVVCSECFEKGLFSVCIIYDPDNTFYSDYAFINYQSEVEILSSGIKTSHNQLKKITV